MGIRRRVMLPGPQQVVLAALHGALLSISAGRAHGNSETSHAAGAAATWVSCALWVVNPGQEARWFVHPLQRVRGRGL